MRERRLQLRVHGHGRATLSEDDVRQLLSAVGDRHPRLQQKVEAALQDPAHDAELALTESAVILLLSELTHHALTIEQRQSTRNARSALQQALQAED